MTRVEENGMVIKEMAKRAESKPTGTYEEIEMHPDCKECEWKDPSQAQCYDGHIQRIGCQNINRKQEKEL